MVLETLQSKMGAINFNLKLAYQMLDRAHTDACLLGVDRELEEKIMMLRDEIKNAREDVAVQGDRICCLARKCADCCINDVGGRVCKSYAEKADAIMELVKQAESK